MRYLRPALVAACLLVSFSPPLAAQTVGDPASPGAIDEGLTLESAIGRTLRFNPDLAVVRREVNAAAAARIQAGARPNPTLSYDLEDSRQRFRSSTALLTQSFELGGKRAARLGLADRNSELARADIELRSAETRAAAIAFFFDVLIAQDRTQLARASLDLAGRGVEVATKRVQAGRVSPVEATRAQVAQTTARAEAMQAEAELFNARVRLSALWGQAIPGFGQVSGDLTTLPEPMSSTLLVERVGQAPEVIRARLAVQQREAIASLARTQRIPDVGITVGNRAIPETGQHAPTVGVSVAIPIFDRNEGNIQEADVRTAQAREQLSATHLRLQTDAEQARQRLIAARSQAELIRSESLPGAQSALDAASRGFELGKFTFLDVLDAQRTLFALRGQLIQVVSEATRSAAELERLLGPLPPAPAATTPSKP